MPKYAARTDGRHAEIRKGLRDCGWYVIDSSKAGFGFPDLVVAGPGGRWVFVEVKSDDGSLNDSQAAIRREAELVGAPYVVARTLQEAIDGVLIACGGRASE